MSNHTIDSPSDPDHAVLTGTVDRRRFIAGAGIAAGSLAAGAYLSPALLGGTAGAATLAPGAAMKARSMTAAAAPTNNILVFLYLRGGFDGLSALAPISSSEYYAKRPTIAVPAASALRISADWGLHPALTQIKALHSAGSAAFVPAAGAPFVDRSHFSAQVLTEIGVGASTTFSSGFLSRYLAATAGAGESPLRAFGTGALVPDSLAGSFAPSAQSLNSLSLSTGGNFASDSTSVTRTLERIYRSTSNPLLKAQALSAIQALNTVGTTLSTAVAPKNMATGLGASLFQIAQLINSGFPVEIATADLANFDFHADMGAATDPKASQYSLLAQMDTAIGAFFAYLDTNASRVTLVAMSEFGRRIAENSSGGADHGNASTMMVLGGGVSPGVKGTWPGLSTTTGGAVVVANDYRTVLGEVISKRLRPVNLATVFPNFSMPTAVGVMS